MVTTWPLKCMTSKSLKSHAFFTQSSSICSCLRLSSLKMCLKEAKSFSASSLEAYWPLFDTFGGFWAQEKQKIISKWCKMLLPVSMLSSSVLQFVFTTTLHNATLGKGNKIQTLNEISPPGPKVCCWNGRWVLSRPGFHFFRDKMQAEKV